MTDCAPVGHVFYYYCVVYSIYIDVHFLSQLSFLISTEICVLNVGTVHHFDEAFRFFQVATHLITRYDGSKAQNDYRCNSHDLLLHAIVPTLFAFIEPMKWKSGKKTVTTIKALLSQKDTNRTKCELNRNNLIRKSLDTVLLMAARFSNSKLCIAFCPHDITHCLFCYFSNRELNLLHKIGRVYLFVKFVGNNTWNLFNYIGNVCTDQIEIIV